MVFDIASKLSNIKPPCYVFSGELFTERAEKVKEAFGDGIDICFSIKANPFLLSMLPEVFSLVEVCSPGELEICKALGIPPERILFSGVNKNSSEIREAVNYGAKYITAESPLHFRAINEVGEEIGKEIPTLLRLTSDSQFGMDRKDILRFINERDSFKGIDIAGLHYFSGTQKRGAKENIKELEKLKSFIREVEEEQGFIIERLEYGTGLSSSYFCSPDQAEQEEMERLLDVAQALRDFSEEMPGLKITVEMGRFFSAQAGFYISGVADVKESDGINYAIMDGGAHQLKYDGQLGGMLIPHTEAFRVRGERVEKVPGDKEWTLAGSLCTTQDIIARNVSLGDLEVGDFLVFHRAGAYSVTEGIALFLSRDLPRVYGVPREGELKLMRDRMETFGFNMTI